jgi:hypothetical protein
VQDRWHWQVRKGCKKKRKNKIQGVKKKGLRERVLGFGDTIISPADG